LPAFKLELPPNSGDWPVIEGTITSPDKITGEKTFNGSYSDGAIFADKVGDAKARLARFEAGQSIPSRKQP